MTPQPRILVGCDGSPESRAAVEWATDYAKATDGTLTLVHAWLWPSFQGVPVTLDGDSDPRQWGRSLLEQLKADVALPDDRAILEVAHGDAAQVLVDFAEDADLLVVGSHGLGVFSRLMLGSVSTRCATNAACPVAVVRAGSARQPELAPVVVGVDDSPGALTALRWAMDYADLMDRRLSVVHALELSAPPIPLAYPVPFSYTVPFDSPRTNGRTGVRKWLRDMVAKVEADRGHNLAQRASYQVLEGSPGNVLARQSDGASIVVVGRRGAGGFRRLVMGSVATALVHHATSTCVVTPPPVT